jgi:hypothetical protein
MEIKLNYTPEELSALLDGLNNALISLDRNYNAIKLGVDDAVPSKLRKLTINEDTMKYRLNAIKELYDYLLTYE